MKIVLKNILWGFIRGVIASAIIYFVCFLIELFTYIGIYRTEKELTFPEYLTTQPMLPMWSVFSAAVFVGFVCVIGILIGFVVGIYRKNTGSTRIKDAYSVEREEGSVRQRQRYAQNIKTMAETLTAKCDENLCYMKNIVETEYASEQALSDIMTELVKYVEYERVIKDYDEDVYKGDDA